MNEQRAVPCPAMATTWDELDATTTMRVVDSIDLELALGCSDELRDRVLALPQAKRDDLRRVLQSKATSTRVVDRHGQAHMVSLMAAPFVLGYSAQNAVPVEPALIRDDEASSLASYWLKAWELMLPGARVIPATTCILLEEVLGASPDAVLACLQDGAAYLQEGIRPHLRIGSRQFRDMWRSAGGPVAATYLALAYVICPEGAGGKNLNVIAGNMSNAAELLRAIFAARREAPSVKVLQPAPFYEALRAAAVAHLQHFAEWGNANDPAWSLDMIAPDASTSIHVIGSCAVESGDDTDVAPVTQVRWGWDRVWWTDDQFARFQLELGQAEPSSASKSRGSSQSGEEAIVGPTAGALH